MTTLYRLFLPVKYQLLFNYTLKLPFGILLFSLRNIRITKFQQMKNSVLFIGLMTLMVGLLSFTFISNGEPWEIPAEYESMENPVQANADNIAVGKTLYNKHCKSCHGSKGLGDGVKTKMVDTEMPDITTDEYKAQKDGVKYYQSIIGRDEMPNYEKKIPDVEDRWSVINYMETL